MRELYFFIFICLSLTACSQEKLTVIKMCSTSENESFITKNYKSQKLEFEGQSLISQINYSYNGWQIYDSISYENKGVKLCVKTFTAVYDVEEKVFEKYSFSGVNCDEDVTFSNEFLRQVNDKYFLSKPYLKDLNFLLELNPYEDGNKYSFKEGVIPSILTEYGIPFNERLNSFSFNINKNNLILDDVFYFFDFTVTRKYKYKESILQNVIITVENKTTSSVLKYEEKFIF